jgi:hypothetical protein
LAAIHFKGLADLKQNLQSRAKAKALQQRQRRRWFWLLGGVLILAALILSYGLLQKERAQRSTPTPQAPSKLEPKPPQKSNPADTTVPPHMFPKKNKPPVAQRKINAPALFAAAFEPYGDASINPRVRDDQNPSTFEQFLQLYWEKKAVQALQVFEKLDTTLQTNDDVLFLKANALLVAGQTDAAQSIFGAIIRRNESRFCPQAAWYFALCLLKKEDLLQAKKQLKGIISQPDHPYRTAAMDLLKQLH